MIGSTELKQASKRNEDDAGFKLVFLWMLHFQLHLMEFVDSGSNQQQVGLPVTVKGSFSPFFGCCDNMFLVPLLSGLSF